jgi:MFS transporter, LAT3 family, solute carrier family 43, member 3
LIGTASVKDEGLFVVIAILLGIGGAMTLTESFPIGFVVDHSHMPILISAINCFFDASAVIFLFCYLIYVHLQISRLVIFVVFGFVSVVLYGVLTVLWYIVEPEFNEKKRVALEYMTPTSPSISAIDDLPSQQSLQPSSSSSSSPSPLPSLKSVHAQNWLQNIPTRLFYFITIYAAIQVLRFNAYFGSAFELLKYLGDESYHYLFTQIFVALLPLGFLTLPVIEYLFKHHGLLGSFQVLNGLSIAYNIILLVPNLPVQVLTFILFITARALLYSLIGTYVAHMFGPVNSGMVYGVLQCIGAIANVLQYPLYILVSYFAPGYRGLTYLNIFFLALCGLLLWFCHHDLKIILSSYSDSDIKMQTYEVVEDDEEGGRKCRGVAGETDKIVVATHEPGENDGRRDTVYNRLHLK